MDYYNIIKRPLNTEKADGLQNNFNFYSFEVDLRANRVEIKKAVEELFQVKVLSVNTMHVIGKVKRRGKITGKRKNWKKAIVKLAESENIDFGRES